MKLSYDQLKNIIFGAVSADLTDKGLHLRRYTQPQIDAWTRMREDLGMRATFGTGISLDFHTNSKKVSLLTANSGVYDFYINGVYRGSENMKEYALSGEPYVFNVADPLGDPLDDARITIYCPRGDQPCVITSLELDDGATLAPHKFDMKILFLGDSITQECTSSVHSLSYTSRLSRFFNAECINQGVGGGRFNHETLAKHDFAPDYITVAFGTNDFSHCTQEELREASAAYFDKLLSLYGDIAKKIFVISPLWRGDLADKQRVMGTLQDARRIIVEEAEKRGMIHIDGLNLVPPLPDYFNDGYLHPNSLGFGIYAENLIKELLKHF